MHLTPRMGLHKRLKLLSASCVSKVRAVEVLDTFAGLEPSMIVPVEISPTLFANFTRDMAESLVQVFEGRSDDDRLRVEVREFGIWVLIPIGATTLHRQFIGEAKLNPLSGVRIH